MLNSPNWDFNREGGGVVTAYHSVDLERMRRETLVGFYVWADEAVSLIKEANLTKREHRKRIFQVGSEPGRNEPQPDHRKKQQHHPLAPPLGHDGTEAFSDEDARDGATVEEGRRDDPRPPDAEQGGRGGLPGCLSEVNRPTEDRGKPRWRKTVRDSSEMATGHSLRTIIHLVIDAETRLAPETIEPVLATFVDTVIEQLLSPRPSAMDLHLDITTTHEVEGYVIRSVTTNFITYCWIGGHTTVPGRSADTGW